MTAALRYSRHPVLAEGSVRSRRRGLKSLLVAAGFLFIGISTASLANITEREIDHTLQSKICPAPATPVDEVVLREECGNSDSKTAWDTFNCQRKVERTNDKIREYNKFVRSCSNRNDTTKPRSPSPPINPPAPRPLPPSNQSSGVPGQGRPVHRGESAGEMAARYEACVAARCDASEQASMKRCIGPNKPSPDKAYNCYKQTRDDFCRSQCL